MSTPEGSASKIVAILNPHSGSSGPEFRQEIEQAFERRHVELQVWETTKEKDGAALAREAKRAGFDLVLACGGDGTVMAVINGLGPAGGEKPGPTLGIVPGGTANLLATALEIPSDVEEAVDVAFDGRRRTIDLGRRDDTLFALGIGVGLTERLVSEASERAKEKIGRWAYLLAMLRELGAKPHRFELKLDGGETLRDRGVAIVIANAGDFGGGMRFAPDAKLDDGRLDVCILRRFGGRDLLRLGVRTVFGGLRSDRALSFHQAAHVELRADPPLEVQIDGEPVPAKTPIVAEALPNALRVCVPKRSP